MERQRRRLSQQTQVGQDIGRHAWPAAQRGRQRQRTRRLTVGGQARQVAKQVQRAIRRQRHVEMAAAFLQAQQQRLDPRGAGVDAARIAECRRPAELLDGTTPDQPMKPASLP